MSEIRPIDANELLSRTEVAPMYAVDAMVCYDLIKTAPTIEPEVQHGRWINDTFCSNCKRFPVDVSIPISNRELTKYFSWCPHCGAKMDEKEDRP